MNVYKCSNCHYPVSPSASTCPRCGVVLIGVKCAQCGYSGSSSEFIGGICPQCHGIAQASVPRSLSPAERLARWKSLRKNILIMLGGVMLCSLLTLALLRDPDDSQPEATHTPPQPTLTMQPTPIFTPTAPQ